MSADRPLRTWEGAVEWLRGQPDQAQLVADCYYDDPLIDAAERYWRSEEWRAVRSLFAGSRGRALDVGAGRGIASYALAKDGFDVTAIEPDPSELVGAGAIRALAAEARLPIRVIEEASERLPFPDNEFDLVFARAVLHHARDLAAATREFFRVLKPGGRFIAIREHVISRTADLPRFLALHPLHGMYGGEHAYRLAEYVSTIEAAGFQRTTALSPWRSEINFAPHSLPSLKRELARLGSAHVPGMRALILGILNLPGAWPLVRFMLERLDRRPGRLYSFATWKAGP